MNFKAVDTSVKKQIKASMKRIAQKLIMLNIDKADSIEFSVAFNIWKSRYISTMSGVRYYDNITVDEELITNLRSTMEVIFLKELDKKPVKVDVPVEMPVENLAKKPATKKQLFYAKYLMDAVRNEPLPERKYTMGEIGLLIKDLKSQMKSS